MNLTPNRTIMVFVLVLLECWLLFAAFSDFHIDKPSASSAWYEWQRHPSPKTEATWLEEKRKVRVMQAAIAATIWSMIAAAAIGIYHVAKKPA